jgi:3-methyladenine DNA glycosylase/8-oxoguanine DNA glycosylase
MGERGSIQGREVRFFFPTPARLAQAGERALRALGLGYRAPYLDATAGRVAAGTT